MVINASRADESVKILDFGIAKVASENNVRATQTGEIFGSPAYMSPEQSLGKSVDARSDQYSLGCVIFELLTGTTPFDTSGSLQAMMAHVQEQAPTLKKASRKDFPAHVEKSVARMLAKEPEDRFADVEEARAAFLGEKEFSAPSRAKKSSKRNKSKAPFEISTRSSIVVERVTRQIFR